MMFFKIYVLILVFSFFTNIYCNIEKNLLNGYWWQIDYNDYTQNFKVIWGDNFNSSQGLFFNNNKIEFLSEGTYLWMFDIKKVDTLRKQYENRYLKETEFELDGDTIKINSIHDNSVIEVIIKSLTSDTLKLINKSLTYEEIFVKRNYDSLPEIKINKIYFENSVCLGNCPAMKVIIKPEREILFRGISDTKIKGCYKGNISENDYNKICMYLKMLNIYMCENRYFNSMTDADFQSTTIIYNDSLKKTIEDYASSGPPELKWFYNLIKKLYLYCDMRPCEDINKREFDLFEE